jgi:hypothetical protein
LLEMSDRLIRIVRMIRFRYTVENAIVRIIRLANWNAHEFCLGPGFHSIQIFTKSSQNFLFKIIDDICIELSRNQNSRKVKIGRGSKVRDSGTRGEEGHCDSHG